MKAWRAAFVALAIAAPIAAVTSMAGCDQGSPARPTSPPIPEASVSLCPQVDPTFESIRANMLATDTCGSDRGGKCHSSSGGSFSGGLDYTVDAPTLYVEFLGDSGTGQLAQNIATQANPAPVVYRVVPGDAGASLLYIKLNLHTKADPNYGSGMPQDNPGALCPAAITAVEQWIDNGAKFDEDASVSIVDASDASDAEALDAGDAGD